MNTLTMSSNTFIATGPTLIIGTATEPARPVAPVRVFGWESIPLFHEHGVEESFVPRGRLFVDGILYEMDMKIIRKISSDVAFGQVFFVGRIFVAKTEEIEFATWFEEAADQFDEVPVRLAGVPGNFIQ